MGWIRDLLVEYREVRDLWGVTTSEIDEAEECREMFTRKCEVICLGPHTPGLCVRFQMTEEKYEEVLHEYLNGVFGDTE